MEHRFSLFRISVRLSALAILCASLAVIWSESKVMADLNTTCIQCDSNNATTQANCGSQRDSCINQCQPGDSICTDHCWNVYYTCSNNGWTGYDNCLYGFTDNSGLCAVTGQGGSPPPSGKGRTPCDNACKQQMLDCRSAGGTTCGEEFNDCKLSCG
ncbi:MAG TPA: hypothetical protein VFD75_12465 [Pyrinomonadaceae bacterium]|nr:hypothetical protein [Pyrinomonadaceae bacterium]